MTTVFVNGHEYFKMGRVREDRIRTFMQLELEACLEEVSWSIRCYNCEVLGCPQEEYPARLLPTLPPDYEDNIINRLRAAQKCILPASLKMICYIRIGAIEACQMDDQCFVCLFFSVAYPDVLLTKQRRLLLLRACYICIQKTIRTGFKREHRVEQHSTASECDLSPRHAAVVTRSEKLETPPKSPAIGTGLNKPGVSPAFEADSPQKEESLFPAETSMEAFLNFNFLSPEQECNFHQPDIGVDYNYSTSSSSQGVRESYEEAAAARDDSLGN